MTTNLQQIQIATALTETGVGDIRWVLLDSSEGAEPSVTVPAAAPAVAVVEAVHVEPAAAPAASPADRPALVATKSVVAEPEDDPRADLTYQVLRALVLVAALTAAWWTASSVIEQRSAPSATPSAARAATP